jgi:hypothetical protein
MTATARPVRATGGHGVIQPSRHARSMIHALRAVRSRLDELDELDEAPTGDDRAVRPLRSVY